MNGIAPGDHVSITLSPPRCGGVCVVKRVSRDLFVPRCGTMRFRLRFPRKYTVCSRVQSGAATGCRRVGWASGDRGILNITGARLLEELPLRTVPAVRSQEPRR
jgi:hypothetical protein